MTTINEQLMASHVAAERGEESRPGSSAGVSGFGLQLDAALLRERVGPDRDEDISVMAALTLDPSHVLVLREPMTIEPSALRTEQQAPPRGADRPPHEASAPHAARSEQAPPRDGGAETSAADEEQQAEGSEPESSAARERGGNDGGNPEARQHSSAAGEAQRVRAAHGPVIRELGIETKSAPIGGAAPSESDAAEAESPADDAALIDVAKAFPSDASDAESESARDEGARALSAAPKPQSVPSQESGFAELLAQSRGKVEGSSPTPAEATNRVAAGAPVETTTPALTSKSLLSVLSRTVESALRAGRQEMQIRLSPPSLGVIHIRFAMHDGVVSARLQVSDPSVHQGLDGSLAELRDALREHGVELADLSLAERDARHDTTGREAESDDTDRATRQSNPKPAGAGRVERPRRADETAVLDIRA